MMKKQTFLEESMLNKIFVKLGFHHTNSAQFMAGVFATIYGTAEILRAKVGKSQPNC